MIEKLKSIFRRNQLKHPKITGELLKEVSEGKARKNTNKPYKVKHYIIRHEGKNIEDIVKIPDFDEVIEHEVIKK